MTFHSHTVGNSIFITNTVEFCLTEVQIIETIGLLE